MSGFHLALLHFSKSQWVLLLTVFELVYRETERITLFGPQLFFLLSASCLSFGNLEALFPRPAPGPRKAVCLSCERGTVRPVICPLPAFLALTSWSFLYQAQIKGKRAQNSEFDLNIHLQFLEQVPNTKASFVLLWVLFILICIFFNVTW